MILIMSFQKLLSNFNKIWVIREIIKVILYKNSKIKIFTVYYFLIKWKNTIDNRENYQIE